ncbi:MAG: NAD kinase [uncultured Thermomicrobiales bacterium]|uniref:NAD kinase n=1 Tax=uncultured Thermomicrobiales bacterium TaxID=1645740 RepID=A0A6J4VCF8_9BACT|nr:MAG: NAD kinase [uncultured Thermomicrobiales bacterium]
MGEARGAQTFGIIAALNKPQAKELEGEITPWLAARGVGCRDEATMVRDGVADLDAIVVLGGDGLMMRAARMFPDVPLLGINFGHVGFLTMVERKDWRAAIEATLAGEHRVQRSPTLQVDVLRGSATVASGWVINDAVIRAGPQLIEVELYVDGQYVNIYPGDGMIVSTPQGSTAYCMSAGGPILTRGVRGFVIIALNPHSPIRIPLVVEEESTIDLVMVNDRPSWLYLDGKIEDAPDLQRGDLIRVRRGQPTFSLVLLEGMSFFTAVRSRFNFLIRPDSVPSRA